MSDKRKISDLIPDHANANKGTERGRYALEASLRQYGAGRSILLDKNGRIIAGNKTVEVAADVGLDDVLIVQTDGTKIVAVQRTDLDIDSPEGRGLAYADNRVGELSLSWDAEQVLADLNAGMDLSGMWRQDELDELIADLQPKGTGCDTEPEIDRADELRQKWGVESGQLWQLGNHRLICGDCTDAAVVTRVMGGENAQTLVFDPEWDNMPAAIAGFDSVLAFCDGATVGDVVTRYGSPTWLFVWDCVSSWYTPNRPLRRAKMCCWYGDISSYDFDGAHYGDAGEPRTVWNTRGEYHFVPDARGKHLSDIFPAPITQLHANSEHSHSKPFDWMRMLIANCTHGDVYDPFSGSGTTMIVCENLKRCCFAVEIVPGYVAVALERWATHTGKTPVIIPNRMT